MLNHLHIANFAIVPELNLDICEGFTAITGETGAGKSILVDALGLLLGDRSDAGWVRAGEDRAELTAEFSVAENAAALEWLDASELSADDICLLRRTIGSNGRSRAYINGTPVTLSQLQAIGQLLVEIHGQNEHLRLTRATEQFRLLDGSGSYIDDIENVYSSYSEWKEIAGKLEALQQDISVSPSELDLLKFQLEELQQHDLAIEAISNLQTEHDRLAAGGALQEALSFAVDTLEPEGSIGAAGINANLNAILGQLQPFDSLDSDIADACQMLQEASVNCVEANHSLRTARDRVDLNPARFEKVAATLSQVSDLARKHRVRMEELGSVRDQLALRIERAGSSEHRQQALQAGLAVALEAYRKAAKQLHDIRSDHARALSGRVIELMSELGMAGGSFELVVAHQPLGDPSERGDDKLQIQLSANPGSPPGPLQKIASGGELSRISLAIKVAAATMNSNDNREAITQIFDEVDAGIGGETANAVGKLLQRLAADGQALCVTHLAQVAVCASNQLQVSKASGETSTQVDTSLLDSDTRVDEIARMLSGRISDQSRAHAQELLNAANN
jgi:DNA repair protein RecN (Recombination protein N)